VTEGRCKHTNLFANTTVLDGQDIFLRNVGVSPNYTAQKTILFNFDFVSTLLFGLNLPITVAALSEA
jgi:hypothetical protein